MKINLKCKLLSLSASLALYCGGASAIELSQYPILQKSVQPLVDEGSYSQAELDRIFSTVKIRPEVVKKKTNAAEKKLTWEGDGRRKGGYKGIFLREDRIQQGVDFWDKYADELDQAYQQYGVEPEVICAIIGVETKFGTILGNNRIIDAVATLANRGSRLQFRQLPEFLRLVRQGHVGMEAHGSYAGAMGIPQFISTSYSAYAVDFNNDGRKDLINSPADAIGSVANYFVEHGWQRGQPISYPIQAKSVKLFDMSTRKLRARSNVAKIREVAHDVPTHLSGSAKANVIKLLGKNDEAQYHMALKNFYVITRYNHSVLYGMAVKELSKAIKLSRASR